MRAERPLVVAAGRGLPNGSSLAVLVVFVAEAAAGVGEPKGSDELDDEEDDEVETAVGAAEADGAFGVPNTSPLFRFGV